MKYTRQFANNTASSLTDIGNDHSQSFIRTMNTCASGDYDDDVVGV